MSASLGHYFIFKKIFQIPQVALFPANCKILESRQFSLSRIRISKEFRTINFSSHYSWIYSCRKTFQKQQIKRLVAKRFRILKYFVAKYNRIFRNCVTKKIRTQKYINQNLVCIKTLQNTEIRKFVKKISGWQNKRFRSSRKKVEYIVSKYGGRKYQVKHFTQTTLMIETFWRKSFQICQSTYVTKCFKQRQ